MSVAIFNMQRKKKRTNAMKILKIDNISHVQFQRL